jgi:hypothetical protein
MLRFLLGAEKEIFSKGTAKTGPSCVLPHVAFTGVKLKNEKNPRKQLNTCIDTPFISYFNVPLGTDRKKRTSTTKCD